MADPGSDIDKHFKDGFEGKGDFRGLNPNWELVQAGLPKVVLGSAILGKLIYSKIAGVSLASVTVAAVLTYALLPTPEAPKDVYEPLGRGVGAHISTISDISDRDFVEKATTETREWLAVHQISMANPASLSLPLETNQEPVLAKLAVIQRRAKANISLLTHEPALGLTTFRNLAPVIPNNWVVVDTESEEQSAVVPPEVIRQIDSAVLASLQAAPSSKNQLLSRWEVTFLAGASWAKGFSNLNEEFGKHELSPLLGIALDYNINTRLSVLGEIHYLRRNGNRLRYSNSEDQFFLRQERVTRQVTIQSLEYLHVPVSVRYRLHDNHSFTGGLFASYLLNTVSERRDVVESNATYQEANLGSRKGYMDGLNRVSYGLTVGYELLAARRVSFGARINQGLNDVTDSSMAQEAGINSRDLQRDYQVYVRLKLY